MLRNPDEVNKRGWEVTHQPKNPPGIRSVSEVAHGPPYSLSLSSLSSSLFKIDDILRRRESVTA